MARLVAFCCSSNFSIALVTGPVNSDLALKLSSSEPETVLFWLSEFSLLKNFLILITFKILVLPFASRIRALVSLISVILAGPCHFGVSLAFLPKGVKSSYQTKLLILKS